MASVHTVTGRCQSLSWLNQKLMKTWLPPKHVYTVLYHADQNVLHSASLQGQESTEVSPGLWMKFCLNCDHQRACVFHLLKALGGEVMSYAFDATFTDIQVGLVPKPKLQCASQCTRSCFLCSLYSCQHCVASHLSSITSSKFLLATDQFLGSPLRDFCPLLLTELIEGLRALLHDQATASQLDLGQDFCFANPNHLMSSF